MKYTGSSFSAKFGHYFLISLCGIFLLTACKKHKENRLAGNYYGDFDYQHIAVNKDTGDTTVFANETYVNQKVQIVRNEDDMVFIREIYSLPLKKVRLNKTNVITVDQDSKEYVLELDVFPDEIQFIETIKTDLVYSYTYQIFDYKGFRN